MLQAGATPGEAHGRPRCAAAGARACPCCASRTPPEYGIGIADAGFVRGGVVMASRTGGERPAHDATALALAGIRDPAQHLPHIDVIQRSFGRHDVRGIRAHVGGPAAIAANALGARGYAIGNDVAFVAAPDIQLAAHEAAHVVQQRGAVSFDDGLGRPDDPHEQHADAVATLTAHGQSAETLLADIPRSGAGGRSSVVQAQFMPPLPFLVRTASAVEVNVVDARRDTSIPWWNPARYTGPVANFFRGDIGMTGIASMVANVIAHLDGRRMHRLNIMDHGNQQGAEIGDDWLTSPADVARFSGTLGRLRPHFASAAIVHMQNCNVGQNQPLICALSAAFGVPVYAGTGAHNPLLGFNLGSYVSCAPGGRFTPDAGRPSTPTPPSPQDGA